MVSPSPPRGGPARRRGVVLVVVILLTLALTLVAHATLLVATTAARSAELRRAAAQARRAAVAGVDLAMEVPWDSPLPRVGGLPDGLEVTVRRHGPGAKGVVALEAQVRSGPATARARQVAWAFRPRAWLSALPGWVTTWAPPHPAALARLGPSAPLACSGVAPRPPWGRGGTDDTRPPGLGGLDADEVARRLRGTRHWHTGPVTVVGDTVRGLLVAERVGIGPGGRVEGVVLSATDIVVAGGGELAGVAVAGGEVRVFPGAVVSPDGCMGLAALRLAAELRRPLALPGTRGLIP